MPHHRSEPLALRLSLGLIRAFRRLVPAVIRDEWVREWEAEIQHKWSTVNRRQAADWRDRADVVRRSTGAIADAAWLRQQFTFDRDIMRDVRYALRMLHRRPAMSALAVLVLSLGIGGTVAVFSVIDTLLLRDMPYRDADRIATVWLTNREHPDERDGVAPGVFLDWRSRSKAFESIAAEDPFSFYYVDGPVPLTLIGGLVTEGFFEALGVTAAAGPHVPPLENTPTANHRSRSSATARGNGCFGGRASIVGEKVAFDSRTYEIVGVLPRWFHPDMQDMVREEEIWAPKVLQKFEYDNRRTRYWRVVARLAPGVDMGQARAELSTISSQLAREFPNTLTNMTATLVPFRDHLAGPIREPLRVVFGAVVLVLLLGCANVASLLLARAADRQREFALRAAIGASAWRMIRQTLVESVVLSMLACLAGLAVAHAAIGGARRRRFEHRATAGRARARSPPDRVCARRVDRDRHPRRPLARDPALEARDSGRARTERRRHDGRARSTPLRVFACCVRSGARAGPARVSGSADTQLHHACPASIRDSPSRTSLSCRCFLTETRYRTDAQRQVFFDQAIERIACRAGRRTCWSRVGDAVRRRQHQHRRWIQGRRTARAA